MTLNGKKILIVGGAGFVGSNLAHYIIDNFEPQILYIVDNLLSSELINIPKSKKINFIKGSISDDNIIKSLPKDIEYVFHLSCYHGNQSSIKNIFDDHENNTLTSLKLFNSIANFDSLKKVVYSAAGCAVAEKTFDAPSATDEDANVSLFHDSPYSISKLIGEMYGNYFFHKDGMPFVKARFQNVYGPREILGAGEWRGTPHTVWRNVTPTFIWKSLNKEALPLDNGGIGSRDFIFVEDIIRGLIQCALLGNPGEAYNLASGKETSILELAESINNITGNPTAIELKKPRDWDRSGKRFGSTTKSKKDIKFLSKIEITEGLIKTIEWTKNNFQLIKKTMRKHQDNLLDVIKYK